MTEQSARNLSIVSEVQAKYEDRDMKKSALYAIMTVMLFSGSINTLVMKAQDRVEVDPIAGAQAVPKDDGKFYYRHPYFQSANTFVGEFMCIVVWALKMKLSKNEPKVDDSGLKTKINPLWLFFPAFFDVTGCTIMFLALSDCAASVYQMMRGIIVVITALLSVALLGRKQFLHHWLSLASIVLGVAIVGMASLLDQGPGNETTSVRGIVLLIISQILISGQLISEEKILQGYNLDPWFMVGIEGFWGVFIYTILLPIFQQVHDCESSLCNYGYLENTSLVFNQFGQHPQLLFESLTIVVSIGIFNACGVFITKFASCAQRSTIDSSRTLVIWFFSLLLGWEKFLPLQIVGFFFLVMGTLCYNEIIVLPFNFNRKNTKEARKKALNAQSESYIDNEREFLVQQHNSALEEK